MHPMTLLLVAIGSAAGGLLRHAVTEVFVGVSGGAAFVATLGVNIAGSAAAGAVAALVADSWPVAWSAPARYAVMAGLLGGFTTFSAFSAQTLTLVQEGRWTPAMLYVAASAGLSIAGCAAGFVLASAGTR